MANRSSIKIDVITTIFSLIKLAENTPGPLFAINIDRPSLNLYFRMHLPNLAEPTMAVKRPLCNYGGTIQELAATDTLPGGGALVSKEVPSGTKNGSNTAFVLSYVPTLGSEQVYLNGVLQNSGAGNDYTILYDTITFTVAPVSTDVILVTYWK